MRVDEARVAARNTLALLRGKRSRPSDHKKLMQLLTNHPTMTVSDLGTTEEELSKLLTTAHRHHAEALLRWLREHSSSSPLEHKVPYIEDHDAFDELLRVADWAPEEFGTTADELLTLRRQTKLRIARTRLDRLRENLGTVSDVTEIKRILQEVDATAEDIGATEDEFPKLTKMVRTRALRATLSNARGPRATPDDCNSIRQELAALDLIPADIGTSDAELERLFTRSLEH